MASSRCAVECATPRCSLASDSRTRGWLPDNSSRPSAFFTDGIGYAGSWPASTAARAGCGFCTTETLYERDFTLGDTFGGLTSGRHPVRDEVRRLVARAGRLLQVVVPLDQLERLVRGGDGVEASA